jgi:HK97 family phage prohead protease
MPVPTREMAAEAKRGLEWREEYGRGGTEVGVARARDISNRKNLSEQTIGRMVSYFARHEVDKQGKGFSPGEEGYPSAGRIAWALWSGDPGWAWAKKEWKKIQSRKSSDFFSSLSNLLSVSSADFAPIADTSIRSFLDDSISIINSMPPGTLSEVFGDHVPMDSSFEVFAASNWFEVHGVNARAIAAEMVKMQSLCDDSMDDLVTKSVSRYKFFLSSNSAKDKIPVTSTSFSSNPLPTIVFIKSFFNLIKKSNFGVHKVSIIKSRPNDSTSINRKEAQMFTRRDISFDDAEIKLSKSGKSMFSGYASVFGGVDSYDDTIMKGAYEDLIDMVNKGSARMPKMFCNHRSYEIPVGKWTKMYEDDKGLYMEGEFTKGNPQAEVIKAGMEHGTIDGLSIGFRVGDYEIIETQGEKLRLIKTVAELPEVSIVTFPADDAARVDLSSVKATLEQINDIRDFEAFLRDAGGFSKALAMATASRAKRLFTQSESESVEMPEELRREILRNYLSTQTL